MEKEPNSEVTSSGEVDERMVSMSARLEEMVLKELSGRLADTLFQGVLAKREAQLSEEVRGCSTCHGSCKGGCANGCSGGCKGCEGGCNGTCKGDCSGTCANSCDSSVGHRLEGTVIGDRIYGATRPILEGFRQVLKKHGYPC